MKILSASQVQEWDLYTIANEPVSSLGLMERAANVCAEWISKRFPVSQYIQVVCGLGNNGGDGLAVARLLAKRAYKVSVFIVRYSETTSEDFEENEKRLQEQKSIVIKNVYSVGDLPDFSKDDLVIDAIFGIGLSRSAEGLAGDVIYSINKSRATIISIDVPSGLFSDKTSINNKNIIKATYTLTFEQPKLAFMYPENAESIGKWEILSIGLHKEYLESATASNCFLAKEDISKILKPRKKFSHKGNYGHALLIAGSYGKMGAAVLSAKGCMRAGAGLLTVRVPKCGYVILQTSLPEAMLDVDSSEICFSKRVDLQKYNALGIGPGIGRAPETEKAFKLLIQEVSVPMVIDADAINILSENKTWLSFTKYENIYTPHPKEFERLIGKSSDNFQRHQMQLDFAKKYFSYVILKGAYTCIACPDGTSYFNSSGNPGMATAGAGDVLTGIILGFLAQGYNSKEACLLGVYIHGLAADIAAEKVSKTALIAEDIISNLGEAFLTIETKKNYVE